MRKTSLSVALALLLTAMLSACSSSGVSGSISTPEAPFVCTLLGAINGCVVDNSLTGCAAGFVTPPFDDSLGALYYNPEVGYFTKGTAPVEMTMYFGPGSQNVEITIDIYDATNFKALGFIDLGGPAPEAVLTATDVISSNSYVTSTLQVLGQLNITSTTQAKAGQWKNGDTVTGSFNVITGGLLTPPADYYQVWIEFTEAPFCQEPPA
jgi:hypothetical protein